MVTSLEVNFELLLFSHILALKLRDLCCLKQVPLNVFPWKVQLQTNGTKAFAMGT